MASASTQTEPFLAERMEWDPVWAGVVVGRHGDDRWVLMEMGYNLRLVVVQGDSTGYRYGWCYSRDVEAVLRHLRAFDPETMDEPMGWHKRPGVYDVRRAPRREVNPEYNRPRCRHGAYVGEECTVDRFCPDQEQ
jgi:hypothetical protein